MIPTEEHLASTYGDISFISNDKILDPLERILQEPGHHPSVLIEAMIQRTVQKFGQAEIIAAKQDFQKSTGPVYHDDEFYHQHMCYFLDYFCFQRPITGDRLGNTPYVDFISSNILTEIKASRELIDVFYELGHYRHSLFQVRKVRKETLTIEDLITREKYCVCHERSALFGYTSSNILQGFIYLLGDKAFLSYGIFMHPKGLARLINKRVRSAFHKQSSEEIPFLLNLSRQNLSWRRHKHLRPEEVYSSR